jgi:hypothetical protein
MTMPEQQFSVSREEFYSASSRGSHGFGVVALRLSPKIPGEAIKNLIRYVGFVPDFQLPVHSARCIPQIIVPSLSLLFKNHFNKVINLKLSI